MKTRTIYRCDCCGKEFSEPDHHNPPMSILDFRMICGGESTHDNELTLGMNGDKIALCHDCTERLLKFLSSEMGFTELYDGTSALGI